MPLSGRNLITRQIKSGKPNYLGDTTLTGQTITGLRFIGRKTQLNSLIL